MSHTSTSESSYLKKNSHYWHTLSVNNVSHELNVEARTGLSEAEVRERLRQCGLNRLQQAKQESIWETILEEIREPMILLLLATGGLYAIWGEPIDTLTIFVVIFIVVGVEIFNERRAEKALAALSQLAEPTVMVRRAGQPRSVPVEEIVPGDVILLESGQRIPADARLIESYGLEVDESSLTGESLPIPKVADLVLLEETPLAERQTLVFAGTLITRGRGAAIVVATGRDTELGRVADLASAGKPPRTPLQRTMRELTRWMVWLALGFSTLVPLLGWLRGGQSPQQMLLTGFSLAFATIPEELPILITIVLALGAYRLSQRQAIVKHLRAAETLSAVTVIATDKTGTLTENRMQVNRLYPPDQTSRVLEIAALCNDVITHHGQFTGDPLEIALVQAAETNQLNLNAFRQAYPLCGEFTFDNTRKRMSTIHDRNGNFWIAVKGAPEPLLAISTQYQSGEFQHSLTDPQRQSILAAASEMAGEGLRVIAFAEKMTSDEPRSQDEAESDLTFIGLAGLADPPRPEVKAAIAACRAAGIRLVMITGDHALTAQEIASQVGLNTNTRLLTGSDLDALSNTDLQAAVNQITVYARTTPEQKLRIVQALQQQGEIVAVTGDGINDAPALTTADIGIAMGETGSEVAREAADIVLADDNFATIVYAVKEGRLLFANLQKAIRYYLACKVALVSATLLPVLLSVPVPFSPVQIILMELFMDLAASVTFVTERAESDLMQRPPRLANAPFMNHRMVSSIFTSAVGLFAAVSVTYLITWYGGAGLAKSQTVAFMTWLLGHVLLAMNLRSERESVFKLGLFSNRFILIWAAAIVAFVLFIMLIPEVQQALKITSLSSKDWTLIISAALLGSFWIEVRKQLNLIRRSRR
ncbi:MAG: cation-transporting P-type ATPase [Phormidesmis sp. CAN_BIN36]|nr:cation-transporting P-type ATPase [Phormidesmis sp. CAN_BIN36]